MSRKLWVRYGLLLLAGVTVLSIYYAYQTVNQDGVFKVRDELGRKIDVQNILEGDVFRKPKDDLPTENTSFQTAQQNSRYVISEHHGMISADDFRKHPFLKTGNRLIDAYNGSSYSENHPGEYGAAVGNDGVNKTLLQEYERKYQINVLLSDQIPLNRHVPDSRTDGCSKLRYEHDLPTASIIIPFYDEWYSILLRTIYSIVNRTPRHLLQEIILVDDNSTLIELKYKLDKEISRSFPTGLVKIVRNRERVGLIACRLEGWKHAVGDVLVFFDSHMEVNIDWLQPLLTEIKNNRKTVAMSVLDYVDRLTFKYNFYHGYFNRYGFDWRLVFFETFFRQEQIGNNITNARNGATMVGAAYAIDKGYFEEVGSYDEGMKVWGGENLEMSWRVWQCGGRLIHLPCSHIGHIARGQPYTFPGGRRRIEVHNYKRAVDVWIEEPLRKFIYDYFPEMKHIEVGDLSSRRALKERLQCKNFTWFIDNVWPELTIFDRNAFGWGSLMNINTSLCLDNHGYLFSEPAPLYAYQCHFHYATQGFSLSRDNLLRTTLQCVILKSGEQSVGSHPYLKSCMLTKDFWQHRKGAIPSPYTTQGVIAATKIEVPVEVKLEKPIALSIPVPDMFPPPPPATTVPPPPKRRGRRRALGGFIKHIKSGLCLSIGVGERPVMAKCVEGSMEQKWTFTHYVP